MRGSNARRTALILWAAFAFVVWNVIFDRKVYEAAVHFTQQQIERHQRGEAVASIDAAFSPQVERAALGASAWGGLVLVAGFVVIVLIDRRSRNS